MRIPEATRHPWRRRGSSWEGGGNGTVRVVTRAPNWAPAFIGVVGIEELTVAILPRQGEVARVA